MIKRGGEVYRYLCRQNQGIIMYIIMPTKSGKRGKEIVCGEQGEL